MQVIQCQLQQQPAGMVAQLTTLWSAFTYDSCVNWKKLVMVDDADFDGKLVEQN